MGNTVLGPWDTSFNKEANSFSLGEFASSGENQTIKYTVNIINK